MIQREWGDGEGGAAAHQAACAAGTVQYHCSAAELRRTRVKARDFDELDNRQCGVSP